VSAPPPIYVSKHVRSQLVIAEVVRVFLIVLTGAALLVGYGMKQFNGLKHAEAMDAAQIGHNLARGEGFTTRFIRPLSMWQVSRGEKVPDYRLQKHPDLNNAPLYPAMISWLIRAMPGGEGAFKAKPAPEFIYFSPDLWVVYGLGVPLALLNGLLVYLLARRFFDSRVAVTAACLFCFSEATFQFAFSGVSLLAAMAWVNLAWLALVIASEGASDDRKQRLGSFLVLVAGVFLGLAFLTKYAAGWMLLPAAVFVLRTWWVPRGPMLAVGMLAVAAAVASPWLLRNLSVGGGLLGLAPYAALQNTTFLPGEMMQRLLDGSVLTVQWKALLQKMIVNARLLWTDDIWTTGYGIIVVLFATTLLRDLQRETLDDFKWALMVALGSLFVVATLIAYVGRTEETMVNADNLVVLAIPAAAVLAAAAFHAWLTEMRIPSLLLQNCIIGALVVVVALPLLLGVVGTRVGRMAFPPYHPPALSRVAGYLRPDEVMVADQPWAVAWYGDRRCIWLPYKMQDFRDIHDQRQHLAALLLTPTTLNMRQQTEVFTKEWAPWGSLLGFAKLPRDFPLRTGRFFVGSELKPVNWDVKRSVTVTDLFAGVCMILATDHSRWKD
jgi:hypothetical protein